MFQFVLKRLFHFLFPASEFDFLQHKLRLLFCFPELLIMVCHWEQAEHLEVLLEPLGKHVRSYYGNQGGGTLPKDTSVAVCTIEKANSLINRLLEEDRLSEVGIIVIDELHMVDTL